MSETINGRGRRSVSAKTADYTVVAGTDNGLCFTNTGATGTITFALPAATVGQWFRFRVKATQALRIDPNGTETVADTTTGAQGAAGKYLYASVIGETVEIECVTAGVWDCCDSLGDWEFEA